MEFDLVIVGGGLAGASLAVALRRSRLRVAVIEANPSVRPAGWDARIYAISPANVEFLSKLGVWEHLAHERLTAVTEMQIFGDAGGSLGFSAYDSGLPALTWIAESSLIHAELWESLKRQHNVTLLCPARPKELALAEDGATLSLDDGRKLHARLVVAADGSNSWVREQAGIEARFTAYDEMGVVANFRCQRPHREVAYQWFRRDGVLAYLPLPGQMMSMVWSTPEGHARELLALDGESLCRRVAEAGGGVLGSLELETPAAAFPLRMMRAARVVQPRLALIGDAAHAIHPLSGHGINLGFQDARVLAECLEGMSAWQDPGELGTLRGYARARAEEPFVLQFATHGLNRLFNNANPLLSTLRNVGMNLTARLPVVRNALVRYAASGRF